MAFKKVLPILPYSQFLREAVAVTKFAASAQAQYAVVGKTKDSLTIRRLNAKENVRPYRLDLAKSYKALVDGKDFKTKDFRHFVSGVHSPARALLVHLGLIIPTDAEKIVFFNTGWMTEYRGLSSDKLQGGGKWVDTHGWGSEIFNFLPFRGKLYGYVQPKIDTQHDNPSTIRIENLGASPEDDYVDGITVVWTARYPQQGGTRIVGWYKNARVFRYDQRPPARSNRKHEGRLHGYYAEAKEADCILLPVDARNVMVKRGLRGWMGQSNVWYAAENPKFVRLISEWIHWGLRPDVTPPAAKGKRSGSGPRQPDLVKRLKVEQEAIACVSKYYNKLGYLVSSVEKDNVGWDLVATGHKISLKLEVKGLSGATIATELTPNEFEKLNKHIGDYRICVVTSALHKPKLQVFSYSQEMEEWIGPGGVVLRIRERTSAIIFTE